MMSRLENSVFTNLSFPEPALSHKMEEHLTFYPKSSQRADRETCSISQKRINSFLLSIKAPVMEEFNVSTYRSVDVSSTSLDKRARGLPFEVSSVNLDKM